MCSYMYLSIYVCIMCMQVPMEPRRGHQILWN